MRAGDKVETPPAEALEFAGWIAEAISRGDAGVLLAAMEGRRINVGTDCRWPEWRTLSADQRARVREAAIERVRELGGEWTAPDGTVWTARPGVLARRVGF